MNILEKAAAGKPIALVLGEDLDRAIGLARQALANALAAEEQANTHGPLTEGAAEFRQLERLTIRGELNEIVASYR